MTEENEIYINAFTRLTLDGVSLGEMQVANPRLVYPLQDAAGVSPEIDIRVGILSDTTFVRSIYDSPITGYFKKGNSFYYRNCNVANAMDTADVFYKGRLPNSFLHIQMTASDSISLNFFATKNFIREGRSRLTRISSIDQAVNNISLACSIFRGYLPFHGAAIEVGPQGQRYSLVFMGYPNTGKTSTSVAAKKALAGDYLAEDICFVRDDVLTLFSGPYTLDETKIQNYDELKSAKYSAATLGAIVMLERTDESESVAVIRPGDDRIYDFLVEMNRYEFEWNHDIFVRHLMIGGARSGFSIARITSLYLDGLRCISQRVPIIRLSGRDPSKWCNLLVQALSNEGFSR